MKSQKHTQKAPQKALQSSRYLFLQSPTTSAEFAEACLSLTPKVSVCQEDQAVFMELGGTRNYFGGEAHQIHAAHQLLQDYAWQGRLVLSDRPEWAYPLAISDRLLVSPGKTFQAVQQLPILRLPFFGDPWRIFTDFDERHDLCQFMRTVGIHFIGEFLRLQLTAIQ